MKAALLTLALSCVPVLLPSAATGEDKPEVEQRSRESGVSSAKLSPDAEEAGTKSGLLAYEPFHYPPGEPVLGQAGGFGWMGTWVRPPYYIGGDPSGFEVVGAAAAGGRRLSAPIGDSGGFMLFTPDGVGGGARGIFRELAIPVSRTIARVGVCYIGIVVRTPAPGERSGGPGVALFLDDLVLRTHVAGGGGILSHPSEFHLRHGSGPRGIAELGRDAPAVALVWEIELLEWGRVRVALYRNPGPEGPTAPELRYEDSPGHSASSIREDRRSFHGFGILAKGPCSLDELRFGTTFEAVLPDPASEVAGRALEATSGAGGRRLAEDLLAAGAYFARRGDTARAEGFFQAALEVLPEEDAKPDRFHPRWKALDALGSLYLEQGDFRAALRYLREAFDRNELVASGRTSAQPSSRLVNLAQAYRALGDGSTAQELDGRAAKQRLTMELPAVFPTELILQAAVCSELGFREALDQTFFHLSERMGAPLGESMGETWGTPETHAVSLLSLDGRGDVDVESVLAAYLSHVEGSEEEPSTGKAQQTFNGLIHLGTLLRDKGRFRRAETLLRRALELSTATDFEEPLLHAQALSSLGLLYWMWGSPEKAEERLRGAAEHAAGYSGDVLFATHFHRANHALLAAEGDDPARAEKLLRAAIEGIDRRVVGVPQGTAAEQAYLERRHLAEGDLGEGFWGLLYPLEGALATTLLRQGKREEARGRALRSMGCYEPARGMLPSPRLTILGNPVDVLAAAGDFVEVEKALILTKGFALDRETGRRFAAQLSGAEGLERMAAGGGAHAGDTALTNTERRVERLLGMRDFERRVAVGDSGSLVGRGRRVSLDAVKRSLPLGHVFVDFFSARDHIREGVGGLCYWAVVVAPGSDRPVDGVRLATADEVDGLIGDLRRALLEGSKRGPDGEPENLVRHLFEIVWRPVARLLPGGTEAAVVCPAGALHFLSFPTLVEPGGGFLGQRLSFRAVTSGRDLVVAFSAVSEKRTATVFADPDFGWEGGGGLAAVGRASESNRGLQGARLKLAPLPGAAWEGRAVAQLARENGYTDVIERLGGEATEKALTRLRPARVLHLATHGFFEPSTQERAAEDRWRKRSRGVGGVRPANERAAAAASALQTPVLLESIDPMKRSGLALAGAQATIEAWSRGEVPPPENDGILTAEEVGTLDLRGTWLVTLSACDTALGGAVPGEGVLGLRRGFVLAGAQNLLMTLWPVADKETADFMLEFYARAMKSGDPGGALAEVQREWLVRLRKERGLAEAVRIAGPFVLSSQGPLPGAGARDEEEREGPKHN